MSYYLLSGLGAAKTTAVEPAPMSTTKKLILGLGALLVLGGLFGAGWWIGKRRKKR